jgi:hypothetical protein
MTWIAFFLFSIIQILIMADSPQLNLKQGIIEIAISQMEILTKNDNI